VSVDDQATIGGLVNTNLLDIEFAERQMMQESALALLRRVAQYTGSASLVLSVSDHTAQIITLQMQITVLQAQQFLPPQCDHTEIETRIIVLTTECDEARRRPAAPGTKEELQEKLAMKTRDTQQSGQEVCGLITQLALALTLAARVAPAAPQGAADRDQEFPDSPDFSGLDRTQLRCQMCQLHMVNWHKPTSFPKEQLKMLYSFNHLRGVAFGQILPHVQENGEIELDGLPACIQLLEAAFGDPDQVATIE